jgi:hypothetical protein
MENMEVSWYMIKFWNLPHLYNSTPTYFTFYTPVHSSYEVHNVNTHEEAWKMAQQVYALSYQANFILGHYSSL